MAAMIFKVPPHWEQLFHIDLEHSFEQPSPSHEGTRKKKGVVVIYVGAS